MWRSGMFWQFFLVSGGLLVAAVVIAGFLIVSSIPPGSAGSALFRVQTWIILVVIGVVGLLLTFVLTRRMIQPLYDLAHGARQIAAGEYGRKVFADGAHEVGILARSFNHTSEQLASQFVQLNEDRQQLRAVLASMEEGVIATDAQQNILFANERAAQLLAFDSRDVVGRRLWEVIRRREIHETVNEVLTAAKVGMKELNWHAPHLKSLTVNASPMPGSPPRGAVLVLHDTTELRRLEKLRQEFVANVSHELKTPLSVIKANVETLLDGAMDDVDHRELFLQRIAEQSETLHRLILDLLSLARIESGTETFVFQPVGLAKVVDICLQHRRSLLEEKKQTLELSAADERVAAWADEEAVLQIVDNLVDNAIKYTPEYGRIEIGWRNEDEWVLLQVKDNGPGIPEKELPRIFERFYRVDKARSRQLGGTGLGLSIVKHLVHGMRGSIQAVSSMGKGATFTVRLPINRQSSNIPA